MRLLFPICSLALTFMLVGCQSKNPSGWSVDRVATRLAEEQDLTNVQLTEATRGRITGTADTSDGTYDVEIVREPHALRWRMKHRTLDLTSSGEFYFDPDTGSHGSRSVSEYIE